ncbi:MAG TPA: ROK family protein [Terriglobia bacterium]|nr:ROK family protein [Terriglobia bacterium]
MRKSQAFIAGIDLGGTSVKVIVADGRNKILASNKKKTDAGSNPKTLINEIASLVERTVADAGIKALSAVSIGAPGTIDMAQGVVDEAPNLGWRNVPLAAWLKSRLKVPVVVNNDVNIGVIGEHAMGAGERVSELAGVFVGTGIGGGLIWGGELYEGSHGWAGEIGHIVLLADGPVCGCGRRGCAEALASRTAMERDVREAVKDGRKSAVTSIMRERKKDRMTSSVIQAALAQNDPVMKEVIERAEYYLGILIANIVNALDPERVVIGGGIAERLGEDFVGPIRKTAAEYFLHPQAIKRVKIVKGALGDEAGPLGAVVLARKRLRRL